MKIVFDQSLIPLNVSNSDFKNTDISIKHLSNLAARVGIYSSIITFPLWIYLAFPDLEKSSKTTSLYSELLVLLPLLILTPFVHELIHLIARPWQIFKDDTYLLIDYKKPVLQMNMCVRPGGKITREGFIWMSLLPLLVLTVLPFSLVAFSIIKIPLLFGALPCLNIALSSVDIMQSAILWKNLEYGQILNVGES